MVKAFSSQLWDLVVSYIVLINYEYTDFYPKKTLWAIFNCFNPIIKSLLNDADISASSAFK